MRQGKLTLMLATKPGSETFLFSPIPTDGMGQGLFRSHCNLGIKTAITVPGTTTAHLWDHVRSLAVVLISSVIGTPLHWVLMLGFPHYLRLSAQ